MSSTGLDKFVLSSTIYMFSSVPHNSAFESGRAVKWHVLARALYHGAPLNANVRPLHRADTATIMGASERKMHLL